MEYKYIIPGRAVTKKNSQQMAFNPKTKRWFPVPSKSYKAYEKAAKASLKPLPSAPIDTKIEIKCVYHLSLNKDGSIPLVKPDLTNLLEATDDILVKFKVIADDNVGVLESHDGSRVIYDDGEPYTEITIKEIEHGT